jgi:acylglycerol lipase
MKHRLSFLLALLTMLSLGMSGCTSLPAASKLPSQYTVYPGAEPGLLKTADGLTLYSQWWKPKQAEPKAVVILLHGTAAHIGAYSPWAEYLTSQGYALFAFDMRGWGQSQGFGRRAFVRSQEDYVDDLKPAFAEVQRLYPSKPIYLQGESLGAGVALLASIRGGFPIKGLILNAPPVYVNLKVGPRLPDWVATPGLWAVGLVGRVAPNAPLYPMQKDFALSFIWDRAIFDDFSHQMIKVDPNFTHSSIAASYITALVRGAANIRANAEKVKEPFILLQGDKDYLISTKSSAKVLMENTSSTDKTRKVYPGMSHCTLHDTGRGAVWADIVSWLDARVPATAESAEAMARRQAETQRVLAETPEQAYRRMENQYGSLASWRPTAPKTVAPAPAAELPKQATAEAELAL